MFGRTEVEWQQLQQAAETYLTSVARSRGMTDYSQLNRELTRATGQAPFDFSREADRTAVGRLLGEVSRRSHLEHGVMLSALVTHKNSTNEGAGFYKLAAELGVMPPKPTSDQKLQVMIEQVNKVHATYRS
ncbi:hypothetical protein [Arthrobacter caoxuetaonis]|uniref:Uncharacterized protein n=1 Tax=Arthrobacter caoxuetaonis TaxID=2886935 RepID=A0A9X1MCI3_9MICC|nr:hypothetical protein [Arthrobacter caoxuetaonis]MCC3296825.1 hypothetical protein [Arthrobacter caoxuetaonis]USQ56357.1 hypothetical protein NF551_11420 [Arthrobacter caoxuetaonis]